MNHSIQEYYKRSSTTQANSTPPGDGFTSSEIAAILKPMSVPFNGTEYAEIPIGGLSTGLAKVQFSGRVVNWRDVFGKSKRESSARGWHIMLIRGEQGVICVRLYFSQQPYPLHLGQLVTIYTNSIVAANTPPYNIKIPYVVTACSIFPGRDAACHVVFQDNDYLQNTYRMPLDYHSEQALAGLINLKSFLAGGNEVPDVKLLVCVKSLSGRKEVQLKNGGVTDLYEVGIFDDTAECVLKLWGNIGLSSGDWHASKTILLISSPGEKVKFHGGVSVGLTHGTLIDVEPQCKDATWLRKWVEKSRKRDCVRQEFPENSFDFDAAIYGINRVLFRIADVDMWYGRPHRFEVFEARSNPGQKFTGFLSLVLIDISLVLHRGRNMLMVTECCGIPVYMNTITSTCKHCSTLLTLSLNPKVIGTLIDETGSIAPGKLLWSDSAWDDLWGRSVEELISMSSVELRLMEQRMLGLRYSICFGWDEEVGRLAVLAVRS